MDVLWSPWRSTYVMASDEKSGCVFCALAKISEPEADKASFVLFRGEFNFVVLNLYPYASGHIMLVPFSHVASLSEAEKRITDELMDLAKKGEKALKVEYGPDGFNIGMNLGQAAGAGVADHFHLHILPRWVGDTNFVTTIGQTRVLPEALEVTYQRLKKHF